MSFILYLHKTNVLRGYTGISLFVRLSIHVSVCLSICVQNISSCQSTGRGINPFTDKPWILGVCSTSLLKTLWKKEKLLVTSNFSFFLGLFYRFQELPSIFIKFESDVCKLFHFPPIRNIVVWDRVKSHLVTVLVYSLKAMNAKDSNSEYS